ncbi:tripeptide aminopeptidase [Granulicatella balaenopterae]|uniref:Tripeptide aminopeptidase n=1 Tax=Granulicatella balaenopterae TaxID=137733 RepID=A0A1H9LNT6_9LACT|nr:M20/M25/M40 family metallo-hydrolase [Granulicatella balaenopterae]SER12805.1 tripeptide aminopeptidase [Granulicatella balaenopterae]
MVIERFLDLVKIDSVSLQEHKVANYIKAFLDELEILYTEDDAGHKLGGTCGNIIARLDSADANSETILLAAHIDTVQPCVGVEPIIEDGVIRSCGDTILGGDDKAGVAVLLELLAHAKQLNGQHKNLICVFSIAEEIGIFGAKNLDIKALGKIDYAYILDGEGQPGKIYNQAPYSAKGTIKIIGKAAHSGVNPEEGINALVVLSDIISQMQIGRIDHETTCNIGKVSGGVATNVVMPSLEVMFEARSLDPQKLDQLLERTEKAFQAGCEKHQASYQFGVKKGTPGFNISTDSPVIENFKQACQKAQLKFSVEACGGGSDTNIYNSEGVAAILLGVGMEKIHTTDEFIKVADIENSLTLVKQLIN